MFRFDRKLGRGPGQQRACEETTVMRQILRSGATGCWIPQAKVEHCIGHERQTLRYLANQYSTLGETEAYLYSTLGETEAYLDSGVPQRLWFGVPRWLWRHLFEAAVRYGVHRLVSRPSVWVGDLRVYASSKGHLRYWRIKEPNLGE
jgi:hypothetical protein